MDVVEQDVPAHRVGGDRLRQAEGPQRRWQERVGRGRRADHQQSGPGHHREADRRPTRHRAADLRADGRRHGGQSHQEQTGAQAEVTEIDHPGLRLLPVLHQVGRRVVEQRHARVRHHLVEDEAGRHERETEPGGRPQGDRVGTSRVDPGQGQDQPALNEVQPVEEDGDAVQGERRVGRGRFEGEEAGALKHGDGPVDQAEGEGQQREADERQQQSPVAGGEAAEAFQELVSGHRLGPAT